MIIKQDINLQDFEFWSGGLDRADLLTSNEFETIESMLDELYPNGLTSTELNDLFWFDFETIADWLGTTEEEIFDRDWYYNNEMIDHEATEELNRLNGNQDSEVKLVPTKIYHLFEYYIKEENQNNRFMDTDNNCYRFCKMSGLIEILDDDRENWWDITSVLHSRDIMSTDIKPYEKAKRI